MSYNIHGGVGVDQRFDLGRTASVIAEAEPDVVLLQEVGDHLGRAKTVNQAAELARRLGTDYVIGYSMPAGPWGYGNVILVHGEVTGHDRFDLSVKGREPRLCLRAKLLLRSGDRLAVVNVHLGLAFGERRRQIDRLLGEGGPTQVAPPLVLGGDFNDWPPGPTTRLLGRAYLDAAWPSLNFRGTFPARLPLVRLDRLYSTGLTIRSYRVHKSRLARIASDHLPIVAEYGHPTVAGWTMAR